MARRNTAQSMVGYPPRNSPGVFPAIIPSCDASVPQALRLTHSLMFQQGNLGNTATRPVLAHLSLVLSNSALEYVPSGLGGGIIYQPQDSHAAEGSRAKSYTEENVDLPEHGDTSSADKNTARVQRCPDDARMSASGTRQQTPPSSFLPTRNQKQWDIANIVSVNDAKLMTPQHWNEIFNLEAKYLPVDWDTRGGPRNCILGVRQRDVNRDHRHRIVKWMSEACRLFHWTSQTFFIAVHAWDAYMTLVPHTVLTEDLARFSAACLYFGAQLVESAADENVKSLEEFTEMCPEAGSPAALREIQVHLVDTLQGISLVRRTPTDFLLLFLAQMQLAPAPCPQLYTVLIEQNLLDVLWDLALGVCLTVYTNGLILDGLPGSHWVAGVMLRILEFACLPLHHDQEIRQLLCNEVFHIPLETLEKHQTVTTGPLMRIVWKFIVENAALPHVKTQSRTQTACGKNASSSIEKSGKARSPPSYHVVRHEQPVGFSEWDITFPSATVVQEVSNHLRSVCLVQAFQQGRCPGLRPSYIAFSGFVSTDSSETTVNKNTSCAAQHAPWLP